jgi:hypothetical protein
MAYSHMDLCQGIELSKNFHQAATNIVADFSLHPLAPTYDGCSKLNYHFEKGKLLLETSPYVDIQHNLANLEPMAVSCDVPGAGEELQAALNDCIAIADLNDPGVQLTLELLKKIAPTAKKILNRAP